MYIDIWIRTPSSHIAVELKYKTRDLAITLNDESYVLKTEHAEDLGRYDFIKDIQRLESFVATHDSTVGWGVLLTNDHLYWTAPIRSDILDTDFRLHPGRVLTGTLEWREGSRPGVKKHRESPLCLDGAYKLEWSDYSQPSQEKNGNLRYLAVQVD